MLTKRLSALDGNYKQNIEEAAKILKNGGTVAIPTETVYGLAASAYINSAVDNIFKAKGRPQDNPLIVHISNMEMLKAVTSSVPEKAFLCAERFWPGPLTMVLPKDEKIASNVCCGLKSVGVRMPADKVARDIIDLAGPLAAPSANLSGRPSPTTAQHVIDDIDGRIDAVVISNDCNVGVESTVVTFCTNPPRLLRPGAVTVEMLAEIVPDILIDPAVLSEPKKGEKVASPGMKYKHYAPNAEVYLVEGNIDTFCNFVNGKQDCLAVCFDEDLDKININKVGYGTKKDQITLAQNLFSVLREVDGFGLKTVYVHAPDKDGVGLAVYNRLIRAAAFRVISL